jgi:ribonuclease Y
MSLVIFLYALGAFLLGALSIFATFRLKRSLEQKKLAQEVETILEKARRDAGDIKYRGRKEAKEIILEERALLEKEMKKKQDSLLESERQLTKKEYALDQKNEERDKQIAKLKIEEDDLVERKKKVQAEVDRCKEIQSELSEKLATVAQMTKDEAKQELIEAIKDEAKKDAVKYIRQIAQQAEESAEKQAKRVLGIAIERFAGEYVSEKTITSVELPSDDLKGRLIGREGRNIRAFEQICGVDLIIDDTPEVVVISSFNVVRREIARHTIERLIADGRIHPAKIEELYEKSKKEMEQQLRELGEKAQMEMGLHGIHPEILKCLGSLNFRTSYTQNQYQHALETAQLAGAMAAELGINVKQARRAGLLHDVGKVLDASMEGSHAIVGANYLKRYNEAPDIVHAIRSHHHEEEGESILAFIVSSADALSGARPGARKAMKESYISRLSDIENIVNSFPGVASSYAVSAGREVRVLVQNDRISDDETAVLARDIAKKIEEDMSYPGNIKITVIRETRAVEVAK